MSGKYCKSIPVVRANGSKEKRDTSIDANIIKPRSRRSEKLDGINIEYHLREAILGWQDSPSKNIVDRRWLTIDSGGINGEVLVYISNKEESSRQGKHTGGTHQTRVTQGLHCCCATCASFESSSLGSRFSSSR